MTKWMSIYTLELVRDKSNLFFSLLFPVIMVVILGNMLSSLDNPDTPIGTIVIAYTATEETAADMFLTALSENEGIVLLETDTAENARIEAQSGKADAALIFESPLRISVAEGDDIYKNRAVTLIAQSFARGYAAFAAAAEQSPDIFAEMMAQDLPDVSGLTADKDLGVSRSMIDYYAVTMIVMIAFMGGGIGGASSMYDMRKSGTLRRMSASPKSRAGLFIETVVGALPQSILMTVCVMVPATLFFGAHYAKTWQDNLLLFAFFVLLITAITAAFMLIGLFVRRVNPYVPIMAVTWALLFMSGTFNKDMMIKGFSEYLPMSIAQRAVFDLTLFGRSGQLVEVMIVCAVILAVSCVIGSALFKRKEIIL